MTDRTQKEWRCSVKLPESIFKGSSESLPELIEMNRRQEEARRRLLDDLTLDEFFVGLNTKDNLTRARVRAALPSRDDRETARLTTRLIGVAASQYENLYLQWQREAIGFLTSFCAEAMSRLGDGVLRVPDGLDYVGLRAEGTPECHPSFRAHKMGNLAGAKARYCDFFADSIGDYCFRQAVGCLVEVKTAGQCLGDEAEEVRLQAREAGDWVMLRSKRCSVEARRVGRLAGLASHNLEMRVHRAGPELGERASDAVIYVYRDARSLGQDGTGVIYVKRGSAFWRTSFRIERTL